MEQSNKPNFDKAYVVAVDMGYGHMRAAYPFLDISKAPEGWGIKEPYIISANNYPGIPKRDMKRWEGARWLYETISRMRELPFIGERIFAAMNHFQRIDHFYPRRDLSGATFQVNYIYALIRKGWGRHLIGSLNRNPLPLITTFFTPAFFAEEHGYKGPIYCLCTDTDIARAWVPLNPKKSRIIYFAPSRRVCERLQEYGVPNERIFTTGFPLPKEVLGDHETDLVKSVTHRRIMKLDPTRVFQKKFAAQIASSLGSTVYGSPAEPVMISFAIGGANAQFQIGLDVISSLAPDIKNGTFSLNLIAGVSKKIKEIFEQAIEREGLNAYVGKGVQIIYKPTKTEYFEEFSDVLLHTDILWTKPSELSFYAGLGLPIIIAPTLGSQEEYNDAWLRVLGAGISQVNPKHASEWLKDWLSTGILAAMALNGYMNVSKRGAYHIEDIVLRGDTAEIKDAHFI
jgi:hypothetical protein